jgi:cell division protein FtsI/penicillin-binding protein 2
VQKLRCGIVLGTLGSLVLAVALAAAHAQARLPEQAAWQRALQAPVVEQTQARVVVLDVATGKLLASVRLKQAAHALANPGSTLKPLILFHAIQSGRWNPAQRVACARTLRLGVHPMNCSHPPLDPMNAEQALAWSCNTYFAALAAQMPPEQLRQALAERGLLGSTGLAAEESVAEFRLPRTAEQMKLAALGVEGVRVTLLELAVAYRRLEQEMEVEMRSRPSAAAAVVRAGLADSASYGMAGAAGLGGVPVAGKTGTAAAAEGTATHGWFVGLAPAERPRVVLAVYVPTGHGANAAAVAAAVLASSPLRSR